MIRARTVQRATTRRLLGALAVCLGCAATVQSPAADLWAGSVGVTSDYLVRGISRSDDHAALQLDGHFIDDSGLVAGLFASNTQIDPDAPRDVELDAYLGFAWSAGSDWRGKVLASYYAYPWNSDGSQYDYGELDLDVSYREWLNVSLGYFPGVVRFLPLRRRGQGAGGIGRVGPAMAAIQKTVGMAGIGYYGLGGGPGPSGYAYWSVGASYDLAPVLLAISYVDASAAAKSLFYNAATGGRWTGTVIWRF